MDTRYRNQLMGLILILCSSLSFADHAKLRVLTSIRPLQLIATAVAGDNAHVDLLLDPNMSPHDYQLRPSDRRKLEAADVVLWIGPTMETFLAPALTSLPGRIKVVSLQTSIGASGDPHLWMDPSLGAAVGLKIADVLSELAPTYGSAFHAHAVQLEKQLMAEDGRLREQISSLKNPRGYLVTHDAYARFEYRYGIQHQAALTDIADLPPSAQHIARIQSLLDAGKISCVIEEPLGSPKVLQTLLKGRNVKIETVDSLAFKESEIAMFYRRLGESMLECLRS